MPRVTRLVAAVVALGATAAAAAALLLPAAAAPSWWVVGALALLTAGGELTYVRLRHGASTEELTLFEAAVVIDVLLLPPALAVAVPVIGLAIASAVRRRSLLKATFNLGAYAAATAALVTTVHVVGADASRFSGRSVLALTLGTAAFAAVNLGCLSQVLAAVEGVPAAGLLREGVALSSFMALGNVALGSVAVAVSASAPALLPFTALPAVALTFAYRAAAQEAEERERSTALLAFSRSLAGRLEPDLLLAEFLRTARDAFGATEAKAVLVPAFGAPAVAVRADASGVHTTPPAAADVALLGLPASPDVRPEPFSLVAPVEAEGSRLGVVALAFGGARPPSGAAAVLTPLASALGVALRAAEHLGRLEEETSKLTAVVDHSSEGILVLDAEARVLLWNAALEQVSGLVAGDAHGRRLADLLTAADVTGAVTDPSRLLGQLTPEQPRGTEDLVLTRPDGDVRWVRLSHAAIHDDTGQLFRDVVVVHDVTRERLLDRLKTDFVATISHELRTPLTPIRGYADLLRRRGDTLTAEARADALDVIADRAAHLGRLVEDLLLASQVSGAPRHSITPGRDDLVRLTHRAVADFPSSAGRLHVRVPETDVPVLCDSTRTLQVIGNLVANALAYSAPGSLVEVAVSAHDGEAAVTVSDSGRGIPADQLERVFEKFHRVEDPLRMTTGGTGLGLYIARQLAEAMGGGLVVHSTLGVGSTFTFSLPRAALPAATPMPAPRAAAPVPCAAAPVPAPRVAERTAALAEG